MGFDKEVDYVIVGGGLSGCVIASRLHDANPALSIALLEAGPDESHNPMVLSPVQYPQLHETSLQYRYESSPQPQILNRKIPNWGGRLRKRYCVNQKSMAVQS